MIEQWSIAGANGQPIIGDAHLPAGAARGVMVIAHGFKGYKDYGMFPRLAREFAAAGLVAHRFNFSHSGMTRKVETFERPDLFERDTWSRQVFDLDAVLAAIAAGVLAGAGRSTWVLGHSRGGVTALLAAARLTYPGGVPDRASECGGVSGAGSGRARRPRTPPPLAGVITLAAPSSCNPLSPDQQQELLAQGWLESVSSRTGQRLRIGRAFLQEQLDNPVAHDVLSVVRQVECPLLVIQGDADATVPVRCAHMLVDAARSGGRQPRMAVIAGADHVFNTPNPLPEEQPTSRELQQAIDAALRFMDERADGG